MEGLFKIIDTHTGLYSKGGAHCDKSKYCWNKRGKIWTNTGYVKLHLRHYCKGDIDTEKWQNNIPANWEVLILKDNGWVKYEQARSLYPQSIDPEVSKEIYKRNLETSIIEYDSLILNFQKLLSKTEGSENLLMIRNIINNLLKQKAELQKKMEWK